jgi:hypothetical protein
MSKLRGTDIEIDFISAKSPVISGLGATRSLNENESGSTIVLDRAAGIVTTLPAACTTGTWYEFAVATSVTSNSYKIITGAGTELLIGEVVSVDTDTSNAVAAFTGNGSTHIAVTMNGTTTGGLRGTHILVKKISSTQWVVKGTNQGSGTVATPFATS